MKKYLPLLLVVILVITACTASNTDNKHVEDYDILVQKPVVENTTGEIGTPDSNYKKEIEVVPLPEEYNVTVEPSLSEGLNKFGFDLTRILYQDNAEDNIFISPYSIYTALGMAACGAAGSTKAEMVDKLNIDNEDKFSQQMGTMLQKFSLYSKDSGFYKMRKDLTQFEVANSIHTRVGLKQEYLDDMKTYFKTEMLPYEWNYIKINKWIEKKTEGKIKDTLPNDDFDTLLINAIYFNGKWQEEFDKNKTSEMFFYPNNDNKVKVDFMNKTYRYQYYEDSLVDIVAIPYKYNEFSMVVVLPKRNIELKDVVNKVNDEYIQKMYTDDNRSKYSKKVVLSLPKFKLEEDYELKKHFRSYGMNKSMSYYGDFSRMNPHLYIEEVIHKTFLEVDEEGTEAAAATVVVMKIRSGGLDPIKYINVDRPFMFFIRHNETGINLFSGIVNNPKK